MSDEKTPIEMIRTQVVERMKERLLEAFLSQLGRLGVADAVETAATALVVVAEATGMQREQLLEVFAWHYDGMMEIKRQNETAAGGAADGPEEQLPMCPGCGMRHEVPPATGVEDDEEIQQLIDALPVGRRGVA